MIGCSLHYGCGPTAVQTHCTLSQHPLYLHQRTEMVYQSQIYQTQTRPLVCQSTIDKVDGVATSINRRKTCKRTRSSKQVPQQGIHRPYSYCVHREQHQLCPYEDYQRSILKECHKSKGHRIPTDCRGYCNSMRGHLHSTSSRGGMHWNVQIC